MRFLVTGGAGFIGSHIVEELVSLNTGEVIAFDNLSVGLKENVPVGAKLVVGDIRDRDSLKKVLKGVDVVFHNAAFVSIRGSFERLEDDLETNCKGTLNLLRECVEAKVRKIIFASSMAVYGKPRRLPVSEKTIPLPNSPYGLSKLRGEMYCKIFQENLRLDTIILRYFNTFGTRQKPSAYVGVLTTFINQALCDQPLTVFGDGTQKRDFVGVKDVARANIQALYYDGHGVFNIGSGQETSVNELADKILNVLGRGEKVYLPAPPSEIPRMRADISRAVNVLGFMPRENILQSIPGLIEEWRKKRESR